VEYKNLTLAESLLIGVPVVLTCTAAFQFKRAWNSAVPCSDWQASLISEFDTGLWIKTATRKNFERSVSSESVSPNQALLGTQGFSEQQKTLFDSPQYKNLLKGKSDLAHVEYEDEENAPLAEGRSA